ncbi:hypothetical protein BGZ73_006543 [Actinomortierella ambigua]|nr:hypothetical protein BGZ73_006543 [Actinomortierella ambigua]
MTRFLSKPVTLIMLAVLQVCTALKPQTGRLYRISSGDLHLEPDEIDRPVHFVPGRQHGLSTVWEISHVDEYRVIIRHPQLNGYLSYIEAHSSAVLMLHSKPTHWMLSKMDDKGHFEIMALVRYKSRPLVVQRHSLDVWPPLASLGFQLKDGSHVLRFEQVNVGHDLKETPSRLGTPSTAIVDGVYQLCSRGCYLTATDHPGSPLRLSNVPSADSEWTIVNVQGCGVSSDGGDGQPCSCVTIQSSSTGLYLGFHSKMNGAMLHMQREPRLWTLDEVRMAMFAIRTAVTVAKDGSKEKPLDAALLPRVGRPVAGLVFPSKDESHEWEILAW